MGTHLAWYSLALGLRDPKARADASVKQIEYPSRRWDSFAEGLRGKDDWVGSDFESRSE